MFKQVERMSNQGTSKSTPVVQGALVLRNIQFRQSDKAIALRNTGAVILIGLEIMTDLPTNAKVSQQNLTPMSPN
jgi:hypothetical protein